MSDSNPHDALFRALLDDPGRAAALIHAHLPPDLRARLADDAAPEAVEGSFIDADLRNSKSDRLFRVALRDGRPAYVYVLLEHKSHPDSRTPVQVLGYMARIWQREAADPAALPPILPMVIYHGQPPWRVATSVIDALDADDGLRAHLRDLRYSVRDLGRLDDDTLADDAETRSGLMALKYAFRPDGGRRLADILRGPRAGGLLERQVLRYIVTTFRSLTADTLRDAVRRAKPDQEDAMVSLAAEQWMQEGRAEGLEKGRKEGRQEGRQEGHWAGKRDALRLAVEARFGPPPPALDRHIDTLAPAALDEALHLALSVESAEALLNRLRGD